jgi:hypothetical protein
MVMYDHTCEGVPISLLSTAFIHECLADGIAVNMERSCLDGYTLAEATEAVKERLRIELLIRSMGLR